MTRPSEERHLDDGTHLTLYRNVSGTLQDKTRVAGDWMIALEVNHPRTVVFVSDQEGKRTVKMVYDTHTLENWGRPEPPVPEKLDYVLYNIDDKEQEEKYLKLHELFTP
jgi:hypothetical protein